MELHDALLKVLGAGGVGVVLTDVREQRLVYVNEAACRIGGYGEDELLRTPSFFELVVPEERERLTARLRSNLENRNASDTGETVGIRKDGSRVPIEYYAQRVQVKGRALVVTLVRDLTGSKLAERARVDLTRQAGEIDALRRLDKQRTRLLRKVAHDIRTPLTPVKIELHLLREKNDALDEEDRHRLDVMDRNLAALQQRIDEYLMRTPDASSYDEWGNGVEEREREKSTGKAG